MPFNAIHLENMLKLSRLGVKVAPPVPRFIRKPIDLNDIVDFVVGRFSMQEASNTVSLRDGA